MTFEEEIQKLLHEGERHEDSAALSDSTTALPYHGRAARAYRQAAVLAEGNLGPHHESTLTIRDRWADSLGESGQIDMAISCNLENVERYKTKYGDKHESTLDAQRRLAGNYLKNSRFIDAIKVYEAIVLAVTAAKMSAEIICQDRTDLAAALFESGDLRNIMRAVDLNIGTLGAAERALGKDHIETIKIRYNLGTELLKLSKYSDASAQFLENISILQMDTRRSRSHRDYAMFLEKCQVSLRICSKRAKKEEQRQQNEENERRKAVELERTRIAAVQEEQRRREEARTERARQEQLEKERWEERQRQNQMEEIAKRKLENEQADQAERAKLERERLEQQFKKQRIEKERAAKRKAQKEEAERERQQREKAEEEHLQREKAEEERLQREKAEEEYLQREEAEEKRLWQEKQQEERQRQENKLEEERLAQQFLASSLTSPPDILPYRSHNSDEVPTVGDNDSVGQLLETRDEDGGLRLEVLIQRRPHSLHETKPETSILARPVPVAPPEVVVNDSKETAVPGGWQQDFDDPISEGDLRKVRSNDNIRKTALLQPSSSDGRSRRASSVDPLRRPYPLQDFQSNLSFLARDIGRADQWFDNVERHAHNFLDKYRNDVYTDKKSRKVKIAILDTGIAKKGTGSEIPPLIALKGSHIKFGKMIDKSLPPHEDTNGHGTHAAGLILMVCPYADVFVYRVLQGKEPLSRKYVTEALTDAIDKKKVDIVSMSFGWEEESDEELSAVINRAKVNNVLLFAATSNEGIQTRGDMAYPARAAEVIAVDAADGDGNPSKFNPPEGENERFTALGEAVNSAFPMQLTEGTDTPGWKRMSGTSCATPIAAAIAGLVLEFSRQRPLCYDPSVEARLKSVAGMKLVFRKLLSSKFASSSNFKYLDPNKLFFYTNDFPEGGEWYQNSSPRLNAANNIIDCLRKQFKIGSAINEKIQEYWSSGGQG